MLQINKLRKKYGDKTILDIDSLQLASGIDHLKGINGSGKTTFSKIIAGLIPYNGEITLDEKYDPVCHRIAYRKRVNFAESEPNYPEFLTANDLIQFIGKAKGATKEDIDFFIDTFGVHEYLFDHVGTYSSGMLKRLSLCIAFLGNPSLIILDEPFNTLDTTASKILIQQIDRYHREHVNFLLVSHQDIGALGIDIDGSYLVKEHTIRRI
jgi:ABC-2 type transport system ATP-binding protein